MQEPRNNVVTTVQTLYDCHSKALAVLRNSLNPVLAQHFTQKQPNNALLVIDPSAPQYVRNLQVILNVTLLIRRGLTLVGNDDELTTTLINLPEYYNLAQECVKTLLHFDLKASPETQQLLSILIDEDRTLFDLFTQETPELAKFTETLSNVVSTDATIALTEVIKGISRYLNQNQAPTHKSSRTQLENIAFSAAPKLANALQHKDEDRRYIVNPEVEGEIITSIKRIGNSLDYLNEALSFENDRIISGFFEGLLSYKEVISAVCSISPVVVSTSAKIKKKIHGVAQKIKPALKEVILHAAKMEDALGLRHGFFLDHIKPYAARYFEFTQNIGMELSEEEKTLFLAERQQNRKNTSAEIQEKIANVVKLKLVIDQVETLLYTSNPIANFAKEDLQTLKSALPLLRLSEQLKIDFENEINAAIEGQTEVAIAWGFLKNIVGHDISLQNQVWRSVKDNFEDIDSYQTTLEYQIFVINNNLFTELLNEKTMDKLTLEGCDFISAHIANNDNEAQAEALLTLIEARRTSLEKASAKPILQTQSSEPVAATSTEELAALNEEIANNNIKMADLIKELQNFLLVNIETYFSEIVVENIQNSERSGIFHINADDPDHIQDIKNLLSALTVIEITFRKAETSYLSAVFQATQLKEIASRFHLNTQQYTTLLNLSFNDHSTNIKKVSTELLSQAKSGFHVKTANDAKKSKSSSEENKERVFFDTFNDFFDFSEYLAGYLNFDTEENTNTIDLSPYVTQMRKIEDLIAHFMSKHFEKDFSQLFTRNSKGLYEIQSDDSPLIRDAKYLLNALHHMATTTKNANTFLHGSYWDMIAVLRSVSTFIKSLNDVNLNASHSQICDLRKQLLSAIQIAVDQQINPILIKMMNQCDTTEQVIGLRQGVLTNPIRSAIDFYQAQSINLGVNVSDKDDNAFLISSDEERTNFLEEAHAELSALESKKNQADKSFAVIKNWLTEITLSNLSASSFETLLDVRSKIRLLGSDNVQAEFAPQLDNLINNFNELLHENNEELNQMYASLCKHINIRHSLLKANQLAAEKALNQFNATKGHRIQVIEEHQQTLALNAEKAEEAKVTAAVVTLLECKAREAVAEGNLTDAELYNNEAMHLAQVAQTLAADSHQGAAKREAAEAQYVIRHLEKELKVKMDPAATPGVKSHGFFVQAILWVLRAICEILDSVVSFFGTLFASLKSAKATPPKWTAPSQTDTSVNSQNKTLEPSFNYSPAKAKAVQAPKSAKQSDPSRSYIAARSGGFFAQAERHSLDDELFTSDTESMEEDPLLDPETSAETITLQG